MSALNMIHDTPLQAAKRLVYSVSIRRRTHSSSKGGTLRVQFSRLALNVIAVYVGQVAPFLLAEDFI
jgi:hypothetical protein